MILVFIFVYVFILIEGIFDVQMVRDLPATQEIQVESLGQEDPL